jgi:hypothetical protein
MMALLLALVVDVPAAASGGVLASWVNLFN